jgi:uncharacterized protein YjiS (DUF1127 family)
MIHFQRTSADAPSISSATATFAAYIRKRAQLALNRRRLRRTMHILKSLDDRTLHDIGLDRSEIESAVSTRGCERRQTVLEMLNRSWR